MKKSRVKTVNNELRILIISTLLFVFSCPVGMLVVITVQDHHAQDDYSTEADELLEGDIEAIDADEQSEELSGEDPDEQPAADMTQVAPEPEAEGEEATTDTEEAPAADATQAPVENEPTEAATEAPAAE